MSSEKRQLLSTSYEPAKAQSERRLPFAELHPELACVHVEIHVTGKGTFGWPGDVVFDSDTYRNVYDCPNPECNMGGVLIEQLVSAMAQGRETAKSMTQKCQGFEGAGVRRCKNSFKLNVSIQYKQSKAQ